MTTVSTFLPTSRTYFTDLDIFLTMKDAESTHNLRESMMPADYSDHTTNAHATPTSPNVFKVRSFISKFPRRIVRQT